MLYLTICHFPFYTAEQDRFLISSHPNSWEDTTSLPRSFAIPQITCHPYPEGYLEVSTYNQLDVPDCFKTSHYMSPVIAAGPDSGPDADKMLQ